MNIIDNTKVIMKPICMTVPQDILDEMNSVYESCLKHQKVSKSEMFRKALRIGLAKIKADIERVESKQTKQL